MYDDTIDDMTKLGGIGQLRALSCSYYSECSKVIGE